MFESDKMASFDINKRKQVRFDLIDFQNNLAFKILFKSENLKFWHDLFVYSPRVGKHEAPNNIKTYTRTKPDYKKVIYTLITL